MPREAHLQHTDVFPAHAAPLDQPPHRCERHRHHVLVLVARRPLAHHQALGVLAGHTVRRLELRGVDGVPVWRARVGPPGKRAGRVWRCRHQSARLNQPGVPRRVDLESVNTRVARGASIGHARQGNGLGCGTRFGQVVCELQPSRGGRSTHRGRLRADWSCSREPRRASVARVAQPLELGARGFHA
eukprot:scaffold7588_cov69-Phaeocystis_antarctica.AAC.3